LFGAREAKRGASQPLLTATRLDFKVCTINTLLIEKLSNTLLHSIMSFSQINIVDDGA